MFLAADGPISEILRNESSYMKRQRQYEHAGVTRYANTNHRNTALRQRRLLQRVGNVAVVLAYIILHVLLIWDLYAVYKLVGPAATIEPTGAADPETAD